MNTEELIAEDFYIEFQTVCQRERDETLPEEIAAWVLKWAAKLKEEDGASDAASSLNGELTAVYEEKERLSQALKTISDQWTTEENKKEYGEDEPLGDFEHAYDEMIKVAREALKATT